MKDKVYYIIMVVVFILLVVTSTITFLVINNSEKGTSNFIKKYYDIMFSNTIINDDNVLVKVDNDNDSIHVEIPNLKKTITFSLDLKNIGNKDAYVSNYSFSNIDTNVDLDNVNISVSIPRDEIIKGGSDKKLNVTVNYNSVNNNITPYYNFNINYLFNEVEFKEE